MLYWSSGEFRTFFWIAFPVASAMLSTGSPTIWENQHRFDMFYLSGYIQKRLTNTVNLIRDAYRAAIYKKWGIYD